MRLTILLLAICVLILQVPRTEAQTSPVLGGSCSENGQVALNPHTSGTLYMLWCDGAVWQSARIHVGSGPGGTSGCSSTTEGTLSYDSTGKNWTFCNGSNFVPFESAAGTAKVKVSSATGVLYPVNTSCNAPACDNGFVSKGCQVGQAESLLNDTALRNAAYYDMTNKVETSGYTGSCNKTFAATGISLFGRVVCSRLCVQG